MATIFILVVFLGLIVGAFYLGTYTYRKLYLTAKQQLELQEIYSQQWGTYSAASQSLQQSITSNSTQATVSTINMVLQLLHSLERSSAINHNSEQQAKISSLIQDFKNISVPTKATMNGL